MLDYYYLVPLPVVLDCLNSHPGPIPMQMHNLGHVISVSETAFSSLKWVFSKIALTP